MNFLLVAIFITNGCTVSVLSLKAELEVIEEVMGFFSLKKCIIVLDQGNPHSIEYIQHFSKKGIASTTMTTRMFFKVMHEEKHSSFRELVVIYSGTRSGKILLSQINYLRYSLRFWWLAFMTDTSSDPKLIPIPFPMMFIWAKKVDGGDTYALWDYYTVKGQVRFGLVGAWFSATGMNIAPNAFEGRTDLRGANLTLMRHFKDACVSYEECVQTDLWMMMGLMMNFSTTIIPENESGEVYLDAASKVVAFHANALASDQTLLDSIAPIWRSTVNLYVRYENDSFNPSSFLRPFTEQTWMFTILVFIMATFCMALILLNSDSSEKPIGNKICFLATDAISNQCGEDIGERMPRRLTTFASRFLALALVPAYTASITSILTLQTPAYPFKDLNGLFEDETYKLTAENNTFMAGYFEYSKNPLSEIITEKYFDDVTTMPVTTDEGIQKTCDGKFALLNTEEKIRGRNLPCKLLKIPTPAFVTFAGMHLAPGSEFRRLFFTNLVKFHETGILDKVTHQTHSQEIEDPDYFVIHLEHVRPLLFFIFGIGMSSAVIIFILEYNFHEIRRVWKTLRRPNKVPITQRRKALYYFEQNWKEELRP